MQVDKQPFLVNAMDLDGTKILVRPEVADDGKGKGILIGDPRVLNESRKILSRKVIAERTPDGGETLKITIKSTNTGGQAQTEDRAKSPVLCIADGPAPRRGRFGSPADGPASRGGRSDGDQKQQLLRSFKPRRPEIDTWKQNTAKAPGRLVKAGQLLISCCLNMSTRRPVTMLGQESDLARLTRRDRRKQLGHLTKQGRINRPETLSN